MIKKLRKGFTLIELVVVIAVVSILAAVSVVTYVSVTNKAKESKNEQLVTQFNNIIKGDPQIHSPHDALRLLNARGTNIVGLEPDQPEKFEYAYYTDCKSVNRVVILEKTDNVPTKIVFPADLKGAIRDRKSSIFRFVVSDENENSHYLKPGDVNLNQKGFSYYLAAGSYSGVDVINCQTGVDVGDNDITELNYSNISGPKQTVMLGTNSLETVVNVNAYDGDGTDCDSVYHAGKAKKVNGNVVGSNSFHELGRVISLIIYDGRAVLETGADIQVVISYDADKVVIDSNGGSYQIAYGVDHDSNDGNVDLEPLEVPEGKTAEEVIEETVEQAEETVVPGSTIKLESIEVSGQKTVFFIGDPFVFDGVCLAHFSEGEPLVVSPEVIEPDMSTAGKNKEVTVSYEFKDKIVTAKYYIEVKAITVEFISLENQTTNYVVGDTFSFDGVCTAHYKNDTETKTVTPTSVTEPDMDTSGPKTIVVSYTEGGVTKTEKYTIEVEDLKPVKITVSGFEDSNHFVVGNPFSFGGKVTATYNNKSTKDVTAYASFSGYNMSVAGNYTVTVTYELNGVSKDTTYPIEVEALKLTSITLSGQKTDDYYVGGTFSFTGACLAHYNNSDFDKPVTPNVISPDMSTAGQKTVVVSYTEGGVTKTAQYNITVDAVVPLSLDLNVQKTSYFVGDEYTLADVICNANFNDGSKKYGVIPTIVSAPNMNTAGQKKVVLSYTESEVTVYSDYYITVQAVEPASISISGQKTMYYVGDVFTFTGTCTVYYNNFTQHEVTPSVTSPDMSTAGQKTVVVSYTEGGVTKTTSYNITVQAVRPSSITLNSEQKTDYYVNETVELVGTCTINYNNGTSKIVNASDVNVSAPDMTSVAQSQPVKVSYAEPGSSAISTTYYINILEAPGNQVIHVQSAADFLGEFSDQSIYIRTETNNFTLKTFIKSDVTFVLDANVKLTNAIAVAAGRNVTIDLNGHDLEFEDASIDTVMTAGNTACAVFVEEGAELTIEDSVGGGRLWANGEIFDEDDPGNFYAIVFVEGTLNINGGRIYNWCGMFEIPATAGPGTVIVNGGTTVAKHIYGGTVIDNR